MQSPFIQLAKYRPYAKGIGEAVADRTINRKIELAFTEPLFVRTILPRRDDIALDDQVAAWAKDNGYLLYGYEVEFGDDQRVELIVRVIGGTRRENWGEVADRVAKGSASLLKTEGFTDREIAAEEARLAQHIRRATLLMSGRHLQHGDETQPTRNMEVMTNCSTAAMSCLLFYLLLNGSGVGRSYEDAMMVVDWAKMPILVPVIDANHPDVLSGEIKAPTLPEALARHGDRQIVQFQVPDSREGWAQAVEIVETMAFEGAHYDKALILDFSDVRERGRPIGGMQDRPASGPGPLMQALESVATLRGCHWKPWLQTLWVDHYLAECVRVGGARRAARMATKDWRDRSVLQFITVKQGGKVLWSANNSVCVDQEFWGNVNFMHDWLQMDDEQRADEAVARADEWGDIEHAYRVFVEVCRASYQDGTGEPGFINQDRLTANEDGIDAYLDSDFIQSDRYALSGMGKTLVRRLVEVFRTLRFKFIVNPCGEIVLSKLGGYCVIADTVPLFAKGSGTMGEPRDLDQWDRDAEDAFRVATRALIRTNLMPSLYAPEVRRTNRIGVGMTGLHEYAWARFGHGFRDLIDEEKSKDFWLTLSRFKRAVVGEAKSYSNLLEVVEPHTNTTMKPAGTTSKLFSLSEGAHLPSMREYLRWVQFRNDDPLIEQYRASGYPVRELKVYGGTTIVGFPTVPLICELGMGDKLVTAAEATPEEQYQWLRLLEKYWIRGVAEDGTTPLPESGNQVSYTLKYDPKVVSLEQFTETLRAGQQTIRCCSVMPQTDATAYEYQPEEPVTKAEFDRICAAIQRDDAPAEDIGLEHVDCGAGACPIDFNADKKAA